MAVISLILMPEGGKLDLGRLNRAQQPRVKLLCLYRDLQHRPETVQGSSPWEGAREENLRGSREFALNTNAHREPNF